MDIFIAIAAIAAMAGKNPIQASFAFSDDAPPFISLVNINWKRIYQRLITKNPDKKYIVPNKYLSITKNIPGNKTDRKTIAEYKKNLRPLFMIFLLNCVK